MSELERAGYVVVADGVIWGTGVTANEAWADFLQEKRDAGVRVLKDHELDEQEACEARGQDWTPASGYRIEPATAALLAQVEAEGGAIAWDEHAGVLCAREEYAAMDESLAPFDRGKAAGLIDQPCDPPASLDADDARAWRHGWSDGQGWGDEEAEDHSVG
jgi:hypothetical protein